jgi:predicted CXXCH cytochrome family protein
MKTNKLWLMGLCVMAFSMYAVSAAFAGPAPGSGIVNSKHDMRSYAGANGGIVDPQGRVCAYCHTPHHALDDAAADYLPLWSHELTQQTFTEYSSPTLDATITDPVLGPSRLCMSCHDGAVAVDQHYGMPGTDVRSGDSWGEIGVGAGGDLSNDHPIGFDYTAIAGTVDDEIRLASTPVSNPNVDTIADLLWDGQWMTCASCHDVHNTDANEDYFLYNQQANSAICLTCHDK